MAYRNHGLAGVSHALAQSDTLEHMLAQLGAEQAWKLHRDPVMLSELTTARPPGSSDLLP
eukprot:9054037-Alexandrium_andersonii.AAC.1